MTRDEKGNDQKTDIMRYYICDFVDVKKGDRN